MYKHNLPYIDEMISSSKRVSTYVVRFAGWKATEVNLGYSLVSKSEQE